LLKGKTNMPSTIKVIVTGDLSLRYCGLSVPENTKSVLRIGFTLQADGSFAGSKAIDVTTSLKMVLKIQGISGTAYTYEFQSLQADGSWKKFDGGNGTISAGFYRREKDYVLGDL
jgi:hypothetical protein